MMSLHFRIKHLLVLYSYKNVVSMKSDVYASTKQRLAILFDLEQNKNS